MGDSSEYRLLETSGFPKDLNRLGPAVSRRIRASLVTRVYPVLRTAPRQAPSAGRLRDWDPPTWRIRVGSWRIFCEIDDQRRIVSLTAADHRKDAYRERTRLDTIS